MTAVDYSQRAEFLLMRLQRWLNVVCDLLSDAMTVGMVATATNLRSHVSGAQVGVALNTMLVTDTTLLKLGENWTMLERWIGVFARLKTLEDTTPSNETDDGGMKPLEEWVWGLLASEVNVAYECEAIAADGACGRRINVLP